MKITYFQGRSSICVWNEMASIGVNGVKWSMLNLDSKAMTSSKGQQSLTALNAK